MYAGDLLILSGLPLLLLGKYQKHSHVLWINMIVAVGSASFAVALYFLWQRFQYPILARFHALLYGVLAVMAALLAIKVVMSRQKNRSC